MLRTGTGDDPQLHVRPVIGSEAEGKVAASPKRFVCLSLSAGRRRAGGAIVEADEPRSQRASEPASQWHAPGGRLDIAPCAVAHRNPAAPRRRKDEAQRHAQPELSRPLLSRAEEATARTGEAAPPPASRSERAPWGMALARRSSPGAAMIRWPRRPRVAAYLVQHQLSDGRRSRTTLPAVQSKLGGPTSRFDSTSG